jgi:signal transduction histidine kinase
MILVLFGSGRNRDFAGEHEIDMYAELMDCIRLGVAKEFPQQRYRNKYLNIRMSPFFAGFEKLTLDFDTQINVYRFVQEAMNNVRKHDFCQTFNSL